MPDQIATINGKPAMMYVGEVPWHRLGKRFETPPASAEQAIQAAGLDWEVGLKPVYAADSRHFCAFPQYRATVRLDKWGQPDCVHFGLVGADYTPLQNREALSFFDTLVAAKGITYETAGALGRGERVWILARVLGDDIAVKGVDIVQKFLLLSNGHDGRTALQIRFTPVRVVCANTLSCALSFGQDILKVYHRPDIHRRVGQAQERVKCILDRFAELASHYEDFADKAMIGELLPNYLKEVFPDPKRRKNESDLSYNRAVDEMNDLRKMGTRLFEEGRGNQTPPIRGTLWAAYNGVTELVDHHWECDTPSQQLAFLWFGEGERIKLRAFDTAVEFSKN